MPEQLKKRNLLSTVLMGIGGALLIAISLVLLPKPAPPIPTEIPGTPFASRVTLEAAKKAYDAGTAIFIDVRSAESFQAGHIKGALSIPEAEIPAHLGELQTNAWIITYCS
jgi:hypothetical protein